LWRAFLPHSDSQPALRSALGWDPRVAVPYWLHCAQTFAEVPQSTLRYCGSTLSTVEYLAVLLEYRRVPQSTLRYCWSTASTLRCAAGIPQSTLRTRVLSKQCALPRARRVLLGQRRRSEGRAEVERRPLGQACPVARVVTESVRRVRFSVPRLGAAQPALSESTERYCVDVASALTDAHGSGARTAECQLVMLAIARV
jgi:hypothetical protein